MEKDPRVGTGVGSTLVPEYFADPSRGPASHRTNKRPADGGGNGPRPRRTATDITTESKEDLGRVTVATELEPGQRLRLVKLLGYGWSSQRSLPSVRDQVEAALASARRSGWDGLVAGQRRYLDDFWDRADIEIEGDAELQVAVRLRSSTLQAGARAEQRGFRPRA